MKLGNLDLEKFVLESHGLAKEKGWWENPRSGEECIMLMVSEMAEATEHVRQKNPLIFQEQFISRGINEREAFKVLPNEGCWSDRFKPDGELVEFADCAIRIADFFGFKGWNLGDLVVAEAMLLDGSMMQSNLSISTPLEQHLLVVKSLCRGDGSQGASYLALALLQLHHIAKWRGHDLAKIIEMKHNYNKTRSYRHGNKAL